MSTFSWTYVTPFLWYCAILTALVFGPILIGKVIRAGRRDMPAPPAVEPESEPVDNLRACVVINGRASHHHVPTRDSEGVEWFVCSHCGETVRRAA